MPPADSAEAPVAAIGEADAEGVREWLTEKASTPAPAPAPAARWTRPLLQTYVEDGRITTGASVQCARVAMALKA